MVHHGGNTTNGLGLRAGIPTLVIALEASKEIMSENGLLEASDAIEEYIWADSRG